MSDGIDQFYGAEDIQPQPDPTPPTTSPKTLNMPRPSRPITQSELAKIWARTVLGIKSESVAQQYSLSPRERVISTQMKITELVNAHPDAPMSAATLRILRKANIMPEVAPRVWFTAMTYRGKYTLASSMIEYIESPMSRVEAINAISEGIGKGVDVGEDEQHLARTCVLYNLPLMAQVVRPFEPKLDIALKDDQLWRVKGVFGLWLELLRQGDCLEQAASHISIPQWADFVTSLNEQTDAFPYYSIGLKEGHELIDWLMVSTTRAQLLGQVKSRFEEDKAPTSRTRPAM